MKSFKIKEENILKRLEERYKVSLVEYNIITSNFLYEVNNEKKRISFESLVHHMEHEENKDVELYDILNSLKCSYFPERIKNYFEEFYKEIEVNLPRDILITKGFIEFYDKENEIFYLPYENDLDIVLKQAKKYIK